MLAPLFTTSIAPPPQPRERSKRDLSITSEGDEARVRKKEGTDLEAARNTSLNDEETRKMRARELAARASSS